MLMKKKNTYIIDDSKLNSPLTCNLVLSDRRSVSIQVGEEGTVTIRAPKYIMSSQLDSIVHSKKSWIIQKYQEAIERNILFPEPQLTNEQLQQLKSLEKRYRQAAKDYIPKRVAYYHQFIAGNYQTVVIRDQKTRWGSCSSRGTLSFNYRLMLAPPAVLDYVIVHELCHLTHMNHSKTFWDAVETILPDYKVHREWLKKHGQELTLSTKLFQ